MALPQNAVEQLSRRSHDSSQGWFGELLMFATTMFFLSIAVYLGLRFGYRGYLDSQNNQYKKDINTFAQKIPQDQQERLVLFYSQLQNLNSLLDRHVTLSKFYPWLEANTVTSVYYTKMVGNIASAQIGLSGQARTLADFAQQLKQFQDQIGEVNRVSFNNVTLGPRGFWQFDMTLYMKPEFFALNPASAPAVAPSQVLPTTTTAPAQPGGTTQP